MNVPVGAAGVRGLGGRGYLANPGLGQGFQLKGDKRGEDKLYDLLPGMELTPMSHINLKPQGIKLASQVGKTCFEEKHQSLTMYLPNNSRFIKGMQRDFLRPVFALPNAPVFF